MLPEDYIVLDSYDIVSVVRIALFQMHEYLELHAGLMLEALLVSDELYGHQFLRLVIEALECLAEAPLAQKLDHLEPKCDVVLEHHLVVASVVVEAKVVGMQGAPLDLLGPDTQEVDLLIVQDLSLLIVREVVHEQLQSLRRSDGELQLLELGLDVFLLVVLDSA